LILSKEVQERIRQVFESEMILGLAKDSPVASSLQMENTFLPELCDGSGTESLFMDERKLIIWKNL